jgi:hypothetical protein
MEASSLDLNGCINSIIRGIKLTNKASLFPIYSHTTEILFDHYGMKNYINRDGNTLNETCVSSITLKGDSFQEILFDFCKNFKSEIALDLDFINFSCAVSSEFNLNNSFTNEMKFSQIRKMVTYAKVILPNPYMREALRALLKPDVIMIIDKINSDEEAEIFVNCFGYFYIQSCSLGSLLTFSTSDFTKDFIGNLSFELETEVSLLSKCFNANTFLNTGFRKGIKNRNMTILISAIGGDPNLILNENDNGWIESASKNLALVDAKFSPVYN